MKLLIFSFAIIVAVSAQYDSPVPPRPVVPGAVPAGRTTTYRRRQQFQQQDDLPLVPQRRLSGRGGQRRLPPPLLDQSLQRPRPTLYQEPLPVRPPPPPVQIAPRPVMEEEVEEENLPLSPPVLPTIQAQPTALPPQPSTPAFRPVPEDFPQPNRQQYHRPAPQPVEEEQVQQYVRQPRPQQESRNQQERHRPVQHNQQFNRQQQVSRPVQKQAVHSKDEPTRQKKPTAQILRKYREENEDGSITWGFENDDGTFKEETIGVDCVTSGKYGYIDPDGVRREYSYSSGIPCEKRDSETEASNNEGYIDYTNNMYVFPNGDKINLDNMVRNRARKPVYRN
ncbi:putative uncharacterized protein DDB_G0294196 [Cimex lectularius]|uniref:CPR type cuticle protein n=1 Tax=Cimex lectularius TaxID=79782 RepID=A0A8I6S2E3_CIMLE|nr:putative uncharacterized protein DDB_G0294196 [Cimex lectularius]